MELVHVELLQEDKMKIISEFKKEGPTAMIRDGLNDALAWYLKGTGLANDISG